jgi:putative zinc finger/helix-turn-helix YgiT family protein
MCGAVAVRLVAADREVVADDGTHLGYRDALMACSSCGERYYTHDQSMASSRARAAALRQHAGLLTPDEIRAFRDQYGLSQAQLEGILRTGAKTVVRWERGTVCQSRAADQLLRLIMASPANLWALAAGASVAIPATEVSDLFQTVSVPDYLEPGVSWVSSAVIGPLTMTTLLDETILVSSSPISAAPVGAARPADLEEARAA